MRTPDVIDLSRYEHLPCPSETERAWAAGFFDGEGWIGGQTVKGAYYVRMAVVQTEIRLA